MVKSLLRKPVIGSAVVDLGLSGLRERKRLLGQWMFFFFCGACLFLGVLKICAYGWFGSAMERVHSVQVRGTILCSHWLSDSPQLNLQGVDAVMVAEFLCHPSTIWPEIDQIDSYYLTTFSFSIDPF